MDFSKYKKLTEIQHVLLRPARYLGAIEPFAQNTYVFENGKVVWRDVVFSPAFLKLFDEIVTNSVDFSKRPEGAHLNRIDITASRITGEITVMDNGGIPVLIHPEEKQWLPDMLLGELRSGSNFNDDDTEGNDAAGQNGEGGSLTGIFSTRFVVETADKKQKFYREYLNNFSDRSEIKISPATTGYTKISYIPDYARLGISLDHDHFAMLERRCYEVAACNPKLKVFLNGKRVEIESFKDFIEMFHDEVLYFEQDRWQIGLAHSTTGFRHTSFVNSTQTFVGGTHIDYVAYQIIDGVRTWINKKTKQDIKPAQIKEHFSLFINARIDKPRYSSQTKENLVTEPKMYGSKLVFDDKFFKKVLGSNVVKEILEWAERKKRMDDEAELRAKMKDGKKKRFNDILKYEPASEKVDRLKCTLFICEGDSASGPLLEARDPTFHGVFPVRGKSMNVRDFDLKVIKKNEELINLMRIIGLEIGVEPVLADLRYGRICIAADMDWDGQHIRGLLINLFQTFWPSLLKAGFIYTLVTPIVRVIQNKKVIEFFDEDEYADWASSQKTPFTHTYLKGLGGNEAEYFEKFLATDDFMVQYIVVDEEDFAAIDIAFEKGSESADIRKKWLYG